MNILDATTAAAVAAATSQQAQCEALIAAWAGGNVTARIFNASTLLDTLTIAPFTIDANATPREVVCGANVARTNTATGTPTRVVFRSGSTDVFEMTAGTSGAQINFAGAIKTLCAPKLAGGSALVAFTANSALPSSLSRDLVVAGDSLTADSYPSAGFRWGVPLAGAPLRLVYNAGIANDTLDDLWSRWTTDVLNKLPNGGVIFLRIGTNSVGDASFGTKYQRFVDSVVGNDSLRMVMFALPPKQNNGSTINGHNATIAAFEPMSSRLLYLQDSLDLGDGSYNALGTHYIDGIHMNAVGQYAQGLAMSPDLLAWLGAAPDPRPTTGDNYADNPASAQWVKNPLMAGSSPNATDWAVGSTGSGTSVTGSVVAASGGDANQTPWQRVTINSVGGATHTLGCATTLAHPAINSSGSPAFIEIVAEVRFNSLNTTALERFDVNLSGSQITGWNKVGLLGNGTLSQTILIHQKLPRNLAQTSSANSLVLSFDITAAGAAGSIGSFDVRCAAVYARES